MKRHIMLLLLPLLASSHLERNKTTMKYLSLIAILICGYAQAYWELVPGTESFDAVVLESDGHRLYLGTRDAVYISDDDGDTWRQTALPHGIQNLEIGGDAVYAWAGADTGMFRSDDRGETWLPKNDGLIHPAGTIPRLRHILATTSRMIVAVGYHQGTWISRDRGDTWHDVTHEWTATQPLAGVDVPLGTGIWSMIEFDGYLWAVYSSYPACRSRDQGDSWEVLLSPNYGGIGNFDRIYDWAEFDNSLYVAGGYSFGRWNEGELIWEVLDRGLPGDVEIGTLAVNRNRVLGAFLRTGLGVWMFEHPSETWMPVGMQDVPVWITAILSHKSNLYAATEEGIYRASIQTIHPYNKALTTWGAIKQ